MPVAIQPVKNRREQRLFYNFAFKVYRSDPNWVPPLWSQRKSYMDKKSAFFQYGEGDFWLAWRHGEVVGTMGTAIDYARNQHMGQRAAIFGFFEVMPGDYDTAKVLWDHACAWAKQRGMQELQGPRCFSSNDEYGFMIQGHEYQPCIMMGHNGAWYKSFAERYGFSKLYENVAYRFELSKIGFDIKNAPSVLVRIAERAQQRHGDDVLYHPRMHDWDREVKELHRVYNTSLAILPEFSPIPLNEFQALANSLKPMIDPELVLIARVDGVVAGFALGLPNLMEALAHANGLQHPWDYVRFQLAVPRIHSGSFKILAMDPAFWGLGLEALMFLRLTDAMIKKGYTWIDASLTGEDNPQTNKLASRMGAVIYRRYREYFINL